MQNLFAVPMFYISGDKSWLYHNILSGWGFCQVWSNEDTFMVWGSSLIIGWHEMKLTLCTPTLWIALKSLLRAWFRITERLRVHGNKPPFSYFFPFSFHSHTQMIPVIYFNKKWHFSNVGWWFHFYQKHLFIHF